MFRIEYKKTFTTGHLKDMTVDCGFSVPDHAHLVKRLRVLRQDEATRRISKECFGSAGTEYFIHHVKGIVSQA